MTKTVNRSDSQQGSPQLRYYHRRALAARLAGLTSHGTPRLRETISRAEDKARRLARYHARARARAKAGLTTRGTERRYRPRINQVELAYREMRESLNIQRPDALTYLEREAA